MIPSASQIMARRWWARTGVRAAALLAILVGASGGIGSGGGTSDLLSVLNQLGGVGGGGGGGGGQLNFAPIVFGMAMQMLAPLGLAATLIAFERRIVRWLVPIPRHRCPRCDYSLIGVHEPRCPECALPLDERVVGDAGAEEGTATLAGGAGGAAGTGASGGAGGSPARRRETRRPDPE